MRISSVDRWRLFLVWIGSGVSGIHAGALRRTLGPVGPMISLARHVAPALDSWLLSVLDTRQRLGQTLAPDNDPRAAGLLATDRAAHPLRAVEADRTPQWLAWMLEGELQRLIRLVEAPEALLCRPEWLAWEVRYWALAATLVRLRQLYWALEQRQGREAAQCALEALAARLGHQTTGAEQAA